MGVALKLHNHTITRINSSRIGRSTALTSSCTVALILWTSHQQKTLSKSRSPRPSNQLGTAILWTAKRPLDIPCCQLIPDTVSTNFCCEHMCLFERSTNCLFHSFATFRHVGTFHDFDFLHVHFCKVQKHEKIIVMLKFRVSGVRKRAQDKLKPRCEKRTAHHDNSLLVSDPESQHYPILSDSNSTSPDTSNLYQAFCFMHCTIPA